MMARIDVMDQLKARLLEPLPAGAARRVIVWHDSDGEFEDRFDELATEGFDGAGVQDGIMPAREVFPRPVRFVKAEDGSLFSVKKIIARDDVASDILLYRRCGRGCLEGDWLADVELYADHFQADYLSLLADELGVANPDEVREALAAHKSFFSAKMRVRKFRECVPAAATAEDVERGVLAVTLGGGTSESATVSAIARGTLCVLLHEGADGLSKLLGKYDAASALASFLERFLGYDGPLCEKGALESLASHVLLTAASSQVSPEALKGLEGHVVARFAPSCVAVLREWAGAGERELDDLYDVCRLVEGECGLPSRFSSMAVAELGELDVFPCVDEAILGSLLSSMAHGSDRASEAHAACSRRRGLCWYDLTSCYYDLLGAIADMAEFRQAHAGGFHLGRPREVWEAYTSDWCAMDSAYRRMRVVYEACLLEGNDAVEEAARLAVSWAEDLYANWFLSESNACWAAACAPEWADCGYVEDVPRQEGFYWHVLPEYAGSAKTCVVIVSDALRYEVAVDIASGLERERGGVVKVGSMQAVFPSVTECGMPALLPHNSLVLSSDGSEVLADGMPTGSTQQRESMIRSVLPSARALRAEDFLSLPATERKALLKGSELVYLYHNKIDATGESLATESDVFDACSDAIEDLVGLARRVCADVPSARVVITADHGFLYTAREIQESQKVGGDDLPASPILRGKRHLVVSGSDEGCVDDEDRSLLISVSMGRLGSDALGFSPRGAVRIKSPGGTSRYVHGGLSLQELCVPVVGFWRVRAGSKDFEDTALASVRVLGEGRRITNSLFSIELIQDEPAVGKVLPAEYELCFTDSSGNPMSDVATVRADLASANPQDRVTKVRFAIRVAAGLPSKGTCILVCRRRDNGAVAWREEYKLDIAFAALDVFGF